MTTTPKVLLKRSSVVGKVPVDSDLDYGELAINFADGKIYYKTSSNQIQAFVDSARVAAIADAVEVVAQAQLDSAEVTSLVDSAYVQALIPESYLASLIDSSYINARSDHYTTANHDSDFEIKYATKSTTNLPEGTNLYYTKARADSDIAASLNDSGNTVSITINNTIEDKVDSAYVLARVNEAPFLDSTDAIQLIDSAYIQARQADLQRDSGFIANIIDSAHVQARQITYDFLDSAEAVGIIDSHVNTAFVDALNVNADKVDGQHGNYYLDWNNTTNKPAILDLTDVSTQITADVDKAFVDALNVDADTLDGQNGTHYLDYTNFTNTPTIPSFGNNYIDSATVVDIITREGLDSDLVIALVDSAYVALRDRFQDSSLVTSTVTQSFVNSLNIDADNLDGQTGTFYLDYNNFTNTPAVASAIDSALVIQLIDSAYVNERVSFTAPSSSRTALGLTAVATGTNTAIWTFDTDASAENFEGLIHGVQLPGSTTGTVLGFKDAGGKYYSIGDNFNSVGTTRTVNASRSSNVVTVSWVGTGYSWVNDTDYVGGFAAAISANGGTLPLISTYSPRISVSASGGFNNPYVVGDATSGTGYGTSSPVYGALVTVAASKSYVSLSNAIDSAYVAARVNALDSAEAIDLIDSAYVRARQNFAYSALTGAPTDLSDFDNDVGYITDASFDDFESREFIGNEGGLTDKVYSFIVPVGVTTISAVAIAGGGGGGGVQSGSGGDGGGGGLSYDTSLAVTPGETLTITVGHSGNGGQAPSDPPGAIGTGDTAENVTIKRSSTILLQANGGTGGAGASNGSGGSGGTTLSYDGGGDGGVRGAGQYTGNGSTSGAASLLGTSGAALTKLYGEGGTGISNHGKKGAVRIIWGAGRSYPDTNIVQTFLNVYSSGIDSAATVSLINSTIDSAYIELRRPAETIFTVVNNGSSAYTFTGDGFSSGRDNPTLYLTRGKTYKFAVSASGHPFQIRVSNGGSAYSTGVTNNGAQTGDIFFTPDMNAPTSLVYQCTNHGGMVGNIVILDDVSVPTFGTDYVDSAYVTSQINALIDGAPGTLDTLNEIAAALNDDDSAYSTLIGLINAKSDLDSAAAINLIDSAYIQARQTAGGGGTVDSADIIAIVDSAYIQARQSSGGSAITIQDEGSSLSTAASTINFVGSGVVASGTGATKTITIAGGSGGSATAVELTQTVFSFSADSGQSSFTGLDVDSGKFQVYLNGLLLPRSDFTHDSSKVDLLVAADSGDVLEVIKFSGNDTGHVAVKQRHYIYTADSGQTLFTGSDDNSQSLSYTQDRINVYLNGLLLLDSADYTQNGAGTTVTLIGGAVAGDIVDIQILSGSTGTFSPLEQTLFEFTADSGQTVFTGSDDNSQTLDFTDDKVTVFLNGVLLANGDYSTSNNNKVTLTTAADSGNLVTINRLSGNNVGVDSGRVTTLITSTIDSAYIQARTAAGTDSAAVISLIDSAYINARVNPFDSSHVLNLVDSAYIQLRDRFQDSSGILAIVDSAYVQARTTAGIDSAAVIQLIDSDYILAKKFVPGDAERRWNITTAAPTGPQEVATGDFWLDRNNLVVYRLTADNNWTTTLPAGTFTAEAGLTSTEWTANGVGGSPASFNIGPSHIPAGPNGTFDRTFLMGTSPYNSGGRWTFTNPAALSYFNIGNTASGHIYSIGYSDGSYMVSNTGISGSKTATPSSYTWYDASNVSLGHTVSNASGTIDIRHPNGTLATYFVLGRNNYGTRGYDAYMFFAGGNTWQRVGEIYDSSDIKNVIDSDYVRLQTRIGDSDIDFGSNKILYSNLYTAESDLPSASTYHGMFAHVHATGAGYFAHAGNWTRLANQSELSSYDSTNTIGIIDSAYIQARQTSGGGGTVDSADIIAIVDSAYVQARQTSGGGGGGLDSALVSQLIDSDYIGTRVDFTRGEFTTQRSQYTATAAQTVFNHSSIDATHLDVYLNGVLQVVGVDYTATTSAVTFTTGITAGHSVTIVERRGRVATQRGLVESKYYFTTPTPITSITGADDNGTTLDYSIGNLDVYLNGILLKDSDDYSTNAGTTVTLISATDSNDLVTLINRKGVVVTPNVENYEFTATANQTVFSGSDINGNTLSYAPGAIQVHMNGIILRTVDYSATNGSSINLVTAANLNDEIIVSAFSNPGQNMELYKFTADSGQTIFSGNDIVGASLAYQPGNIQVFMNGLLLNDSDDYNALNGMSVVLTSGADASDEIKIASFVSNTNAIKTNAWSAPSGTPIAATVGDKLFIDTSTAKTITLPSSAIMGDEIRIIDVTGNAATNNITVARNGHKIQGGTTDLTINVDRAGIGLVYYNVAQGWVLIEN